MLKSAVRYEIQKPAAQSMFNCHFCLSHSSVSLTVASCTSAFCLTTSHTLLTVLLHAQLLTQEMFTSKLKAAVFSWQERQHLHESLKLKTNIELTRYMYFTTSPSSLRIAVDQTALLAITLQYVCDTSSGTTKYPTASRNSTFHWNSSRHHQVIPIEQLHVWCERSPAGRRHQRQGQTEKTGGLLRASWLATDV